MFNAGSFAPKDQPGQRVQAEQLVVETWELVVELFMVVDGACDVVVELLIEVKEV